jgi:hypothetical protein
MLSPCVYEGPTPPVLPVLHLFLCTLSNVSYYHRVS